MKIKNFNKVKNNHKNHKFLDDVFWEDCVNEETLSKQISFRASSIKMKKHNTKNEKVRKIKYKINIYDQHKSNIINNCYKNYAKKFQTYIRRRRKI